MEKRKKISQIAEKYIKNRRDGYLGSGNPADSDDNSVNYSLSLEELMAELVERIDSNRATGDE